MKYRLLLTNMADGEEREIIVPARLPLEDLSVKLKVEFQLPLCDHGWHRFLSHGTTYVIDEHLCAETDMLWEADIRPGRYRSSEHIPLCKVFTVLGSGITYKQEERGYDIHKVRITLLERM